MKSHPIAVAIVACALVGGCVAPSPGATAISPVVSAAVDPDEPHEAAGPSLAADGAASSAAAVAGGRVVEVFLTGHENEVAWRAALDPLVSDGWRSYYAAVDPVRVPSGAVTGSAVARPMTSALVAVVDVPTTVGQLTVTLVREPEGDRWLADRITGVQP